MFSLPKGQACFQHNGVSDDKQVICLEQFKKTSAEKKFVFHSFFFFIQIRTCKVQESIKIHWKTKMENLLQMENHFKPCSSKSRKWTKRDFELSGEDVDHICTHFKLFASFVIYMKNIKYDIY